MSQDRVDTAFFRGNVVPAEYIVHPDKTYACNPYIEALPPSISDAKAASLLRRMPRYDEKERLASALERVTFAQRVTNCMVPLPEHLLMVRKFQRMILDGYLARNPLSSEWVKQVRSAFPDIDWDGPYPGYFPIVRKTGTGCNCTGTSGVGKTTMVESALSLLPQVIEHTCYHGQAFDQKQLVWLKLECPSDGSLKALCQSFFMVSDAVLGKPTDPKNYSGMTAEYLVPLMARRASTLGLGVLVVDEIQRLNRAASGGADRMLKFFVQLANNLGVPVVLIGTFEAASLFVNDFASARRSSGKQGEMVMSNMQPDQIWDYFLDSIWRYQFTNVPTPLTPALSKAFYAESQGIADICIKLYMLAQIQVIGTPDERITPELVADVARANLHSARPMLDALRRGDKQALSNIPDLYLPQNLLDQCRARAEHRIILTGTLDTIKNQSYHRLNTDAEYVEPPDDKIAKLLVQAGYSQILAVKSAGEAVARFAQESDIKLATSEAFRIAAEQEADQKIDVTARKPAGPRPQAKVVSISGDLREIFKKRPKTMEPYEAFKQAGVIKPADEFLGVC
ncbi:ATP-binding protein [Geomonas subterranea]|uniref:ATP-binding protein n=1 Tax=Geomonas subterranea TaxID=2847989 RepID=UPI001CD72E9B|nr:ATP-binding protein [Geomonas fuzhouensis]